MFASRTKAAPVREFKKGLDNEDARRKREDNVISLRRTAREEHTQKRRVAATGAVADASTLTSVYTKAANEPVTGTIRDKLRELPQLVASLQSDDNGRQLEAVTIFRKLLSIEQGPPIQEVIDSGIVRRLVALLSFDHAPTIQFEAAWTLTNIASGTSAQTRAVAEGGAVPAFVRLLASPAEDVREQSVWALGNIAGDCTAMRDHVLNEGAFPALVKICIPEAKITMIRNAVWAMSNLCRGKPQPDFSKIAGALPKLVDLLQIKDEEVLTDTCWALSYISDDKNETNPKIRAVIEAGACPLLVKLLAHKSDKVRTPALRTVGNIVTGDDSQTQAILEQNALIPLHSMLRDGKKGIRKEACWTLSNITAGSSKQIAAVLQGGLFKDLIKLMTGGDFEVQKEACWAMSNATSGGDAATLGELARLGLMQAFVDLLDANADSKMIMVCLDGLENMLRSGKLVAARTTGENIMCEVLEEAGGLDTLEKLQQHENEEIYNKAIKMLKDFFEEDAEDDKSEAALAPAQNGNAFAFGAPAPAAQSSDKSNPFGSSAFAFGGDKAAAPFAFGAAPSTVAPSANPFAFSAGPPVTTPFSF